MKMIDVNKDLTEAPEDLKPNLKGRPNTRAQRLKQKVKKHTPFSAKKRREAETKDKIFQLAKSIKLDFAEHMQNYPDKTVPTVAHMEEFFKGGEYEQYVNQVAIDLKFRKEEKPEPKAAETGGEEETKDTGLTKVGGDTEGENIKLADEPEDKAAQKAAMSAHIKKGAEEEGKKLNPEDTDIEGDLPEEAGDDKESKVDTSASIYESRLRSMLFELKDNEVDTLIVRIIQAQQRSKGGPAQPSPEPGAKQNREASADSDVSDEGTNDDAVVPSAWKNELFGLLKKIRKGGELDEKDKKLAGKLYDQIN